MEFGTVLRSFSYVEADLVRVLSKFFLILMGPRSSQEVVDKRVPGLRIRDCARGCSNCAQLCPQLNAIEVTARTFFERLYLDLGL